jgi:threonine dehydratase
VEAIFRRGCLRVVHCIEAAAQSKMERFAVRLERPSLRTKLQEKRGSKRMRLSLPAIREAQEFLRGYFGTTRLLEAPFLSAEASRRVWLKLEMELPTGSFKVRGASWALAARLQRGRVEEVAASSTGNHGAAVAWAGKLLGVKARIFLPAECNPVKRARIAALGAEIVESSGTDLASAFVLAKEYAARSGVYFLNDATDEDLPAGPGTIGLEILEQVPAASAIFVPMGDTALIRGVGAAVKQTAPRVKIIGVQAEQAPSYYLSWKENKVVGTQTCDTIADGLATRTPDAANVHNIRELVDDVILVSEDEMLRAIGTLLIEEHVLAEPAAAASTAALRKTASRSNYGENLVLLVSGANISKEILQRAVSML